MPLVDFKHGKFLSSISINYHNANILKTFFFENKFQQNKESTYGNVICKLFQQSQQFKFSAQC